MRQKQVLSACAMSSTKTSPKTILSPQLEIWKTAGAASTYDTFQQKPMKTFKPFPRREAYLDIPVEKLAARALRFRFVAVFKVLHAIPVGWPDS